MQTVTVTRDQAAKIFANDDIDATVRETARRVLNWIDGEPIKPVSVELDFGSPELNSAVYAALHPARRESFYVIREQTDSGRVITEQGADWLQDAYTKADEIRVANPLADIVCVERATGAVAFHRPAAKVGMPATYSIGSDSYPGTIVSVSGRGTKIGFSHNGKVASFHATLRKTGKYRPIGGNNGVVTVGFARSRRDPSF